MHSKRASYPFMAILLLATSSLATPAMAKHGNERGHGNGHHEDDNRHNDWDDDDHDNDRHGDHDRDRDDHRTVYRGHDDGRVLINLSVDQRQVIYERLQPVYVRRCPPGLAKKHNGCLPPGHAQHYVIGQPLPQGTVVWEVPQDVLVALPPPPPAAQYVWVDRNVLLVSEASKKVLDAAVLLSGVQ